MIVDKNTIAKRLGIDVQSAAVLLARACERGEIYGREFFGGIKYQVTQEWMDKHEIQSR